MFDRWLTDLLTTLIRRVKHDPAYRLDPDMGGAALLLIVGRRGLALVRGLWWAWRLRGCRLPFFVGHGVSIRHAGRLTAGRGVTLEEYVQIDALSREGVYLGDNVSVGRFSVIEATGALTQLGAGCSIGANSNLGDYNFVGAAGGVRIGENVLIGQRVSFHSENHVADRTDIPMKAQGVTHQGIIVEDDCWLGTGATLLDGVTIGRGSIVAAGAVVTRSVAPFSVVGGVPARVIRNRIEDGERRDG